MAAGMGAAFAAAGRPTVEQLPDGWRTAGMDGARTTASCQQGGNGAVVVDPRDGCVLVSASCRRRFHPLKCVLLTHPCLCDDARVRKPAWLRIDEAHAVSEDGMAAEHPACRRLHNPHKSLTVLMFSLRSF